MFYLQIKRITIPRFIKLRLINDYTGLSLKKNIEKCCVLSHDALLNTDGEKGFNTPNEEIQVKNEKISYEEKDHRLLWLNIIIGNIKNNITGIYHGITKREMPLFLNEQEYRFNYRKMGMTAMDKIKEYPQKSFPISHRQIVYIRTFLLHTSFKSLPVDYRYSKIFFINKINNLFMNYIYLLLVQQFYSIRKL